MSVVLDTDHCIAILRGKLDVSGRVQPSTPLFVTVVTVSELIYGAHKSDRVSDHLAQVEVLFGAATILAFDTESARRCGQLKDTLRRAGTPIAEPDLQIASICLHYDLPLATHNQRHFARVPSIQLIDWMV